MEHAGLAERAGLVALVSATGVEWVLDAESPSARSAEEGGTGR